MRMRRNASIFVDTAFVIENLLEYQAKSVMHIGI
jgi:hypothetical protein